MANTEEKLTDSTAESNTTKRYFGLIAKCTYTDATKEYFYMPFNDDYNGWQYTSCVIAPKKANQSKTIESITVIMAYDCNANTVWFDNISLRQEPCTTYTYDSEGNVTAVNATGNSGADFTYASGTTASYTYDVAGIRDSKTVTTSSGTTTYNYLTQNGQVVRQTWGSHTMDFFYDNSGKPVSCIYDGTTYIYVLNLQGDVIRMVTTTGATVATYVYDAWGKVISSSGSMSSVNPIRYRGYYYDTETGLYYLQSRYYDPAVKRFVNADGHASTGQGFIGYNMFAYCNNNAVCSADPSGNLYEWVLKYYGREYYYEYLRRVAYKSADAAASGFSQKNYDASYYIRHEVAATIYSFSENGTTLYGYTTPNWGLPHGVSIKLKVPYGTTRVAYVHTHPNSNEFSNTDIDTANNFNMDAYAIGPKHELICYDHRTKEDRSVGVISVDSADPNWIRIFEPMYFISWGHHIQNPCDFNCDEKQWPAK